jgi:4-amino-4-deoxy-L-arabinose transferase-like glycosyltransferase
MINNLTLENKIRLLIVFAGLCLFLPFNGMIHLFDWDEINFAESAREMIVTGNYNTVTINFIPFWEKPPLFIWMQVLSMKVFGINEFAARFPNALCGIATLIILFEIGKSLKGIKFGLVWATAYGTSLLPFLYFKSGIIDPWFNLFIFSALYFVFLYLKQRATGITSIKNLLISGLILGFAVLTKGPAAILLYGLTLLIYLTIERKWHLLKISHVSLFALVLILCGGSYHIYQFLIGNGQLVYDFFKYQLRLMKTEDAGHGGSIFYHPIVLFIGVFPASILAISGFIRAENDHNDFRRLMLVLFFVVLTIFSLVQTKIVHYSSLCYFPLSYLAAIQAYRICFDGERLTKTNRILILVIGLFYAIVPALLQLIATTIPIDTLKTFIKDDFALACIDRSIVWTGAEFLIGIFLGVMLITSIVRWHSTKQMIAIFASTMAFVLLLMIFVVPKIEKYSQAPAIAFMERFKDKPVWISPLGYYSYAHLFYSNKSNRACINCDEEEFLLQKNSDRPVYFVAKSTQEKELLEKYPKLEVKERKGGFILLEKMIK